MTVENSKRLYDHYISINKIKAAEDMLEKYPQFAEVKEKPKASKKKEAEEEEQKD